MPAPLLSAPAARQGPGPMPDRLVDALDLALTRRTGRALPGDRLAAGVGQGTELAQLRPYQVGDDVRHLDAASSARTGEPHVRLQVPERTVTTWIALDVSASMAFGTATRLKADVAEGVARVIGRLAVRRAGALGLVRFGAGERPVITPPRASRPALVALHRALSDGVAPDGRADRHALSDACVRVGRLARQPGIVVVISDFRDQDGLAGAVGALRARHAVVCVEVTDPRELEVPAVGRLALVDPETGRHVAVDTSSPRVRERFAALEAGRRAELADELRGLRIDHVALSTEGDWLLALARELS